MNRRLALIPLAAAIAALSACHQGGVGVDSGASQKATTNSESTLRSDRSIQAGTSAQASIQMPASALALQAFANYGKRVKPPPIGANSSPQPDTVQRFGFVAVASMAHPWQGWPFGCFGCSKEGVWARGMAQQVIFANTTLSEILPKLGAQTLADPAAAQAAIIAAYKTIPPAQLIKAYNQAGQQVQGEINFDFTGSCPAPIHFMIGSNDFQAGPTGWKWSMASVPWFGEGRISGKDMQLSLRSAIDKTQAQTSTTGTSSGEGAEQGAGGSAGVK